MQKFLSVYFHFKNLKEVIKVKLLIKMASRNILRNKRRSILTLLAIIFATFLSIGMRGMQRGVYNLTISTALDFFTGHLQIQEKNYNKKKSLRNCFKYNRQLLNKVQNIEGVKAAAPRIMSAGLISYKNNSFGTAIFGIDPDKEKKCTTLLTRIKKGNFFYSDSSDEIVLGQTLFENLKAKIGDSIVLLAQGYDGSMGNLKYKITGTVKTGSQQLDAMAAFIPFKSAQDLLLLYGKAHSIAIKLDNLEQVSLMKEKIIAEIPNKNLSVLSWQELLPELLQSIELDNISGIFFLAILIIVVAFGILNTVLMSVTERFREFGVALAIGISNKKLMLIVMLETLFLVFIGLLIGNLIGYGIVYYFHYHPYIFTGDMAKMYEMYGFSPKLQTDLSIPVFLNTSILILITAVITSIYPLIKLFKLEALKGIRYT